MIGLLVLVALLVTMSLALADSNGTCGDNATWSYSNGTLTISGTGPMYNYGQGNTPWKDYRSSIQQVVIEDGITGIGAYAFYGSNPNNFKYFDAVTSLSIPSTVTTIGECAFGDWDGLFTLQIPSSVRTIGASAFSGCNNLVTITADNGLVSIGNSAFYGCSSLTFVSLPDSVVNLGTDIFNNCKSLSMFTIPSGVRNIPNGMFEYCTGLTYVSIPNSVVNIG